MYGLWSDGTIPREWTAAVDLSSWRSRAGGPARRIEPGEERGLEDRPRGLEQAGCWCHDRSSEEGIWRLCGEGDDCRRVCKWSIERIVVLSLVWMFRQMQIVHKLASLSPPKGYSGRRACARLCA